MPLSDYEIVHVANGERIIKMPRSFNYLYGGVMTALGLAAVIGIPFLGFDTKSAFIAFGAGLACLGYGPLTVLGQSEVALTKQEIHSYLNLFNAKLFTKRCQFRDIGNIQTTSDKQVRIRQSDGESWIIEGFKTQSDAEEFVAFLTNHINSGGSTAS